MVCCLKINACSESLLYFAVFIRNIKFSGEYNNFIQFRSNFKSLFSKVLIDIVTEWSVEDHWFDCVYCSECVYPHLLVAAWVVKKTSKTWAEAITWATFLFKECALVGCGCDVGPEMLFTYLLLPLSIFKCIF